MSTGYHMSENIRCGKGRHEIVRYINLKLASMEQPFYEGQRSQDGSGLSEQEFIDLAESLLSNYREKRRLLSDTLTNPADQRIQSFINRYLADIEFVDELVLPFDSFVLDKPGLGRAVSLPPDQNTFQNEHLTSYRVRQGILHNPRSDRRTTAGTFHIVKGGLPVPPDKKAVPKIAFAHLFREAFRPPESLLQLPFTAGQTRKAQVFVSLLLRPRVCPEVPGILSGKSMEIRFFAPGGLVANLDFVESIFGNAGDPYLHRNDAALDVEHWTGHTGCIILAPHLTRLRKRDLGLPAWEDASERMRRDGMCWRDETELYNDGKPFKISCRDEQGVAITLLADNYFGYSKKEIKSMISYSANLYGLCEEEHAGGTLAFGCKNLGDDFSGEDFYHREPLPQTFAELQQRYTELIDFRPEGYGIDRRHPQIRYVPENTRFNLYESRASWIRDGRQEELQLLREHHYILPSGHKLHMERHPFDPSWRLVLTNALGVFCHKPSTVSGGGKSEISKSLQNAIMYGYLAIGDLNETFALVEEILHDDYRKRWKNPALENTDSQPDSLLSPQYRVGSIIKLLTPHPDYSEAYNERLSRIPDSVKTLVLFIKKLVMSGFSGDYRSLFATNIINGRQDTRLLFRNRKISTSYLRVGFSASGDWSLFSLRPDFMAAAKIQMEDDISVSITLPDPDSDFRISRKLVENCEYLFFQRPDEAIHRGYDKEAEEDLAKPDNFITNYQPLSAADGREMCLEAIAFDEYTPPIREIITSGAQEPDGSFFISPSHPRINADGRRSENPRYLQKSPAFFKPVAPYLAEIGTRLARSIPAHEPVRFPVDSILMGRRNNPADPAKGIRALSVYGPIHYQELPELFMDLICSLTGKSPSTTGAGSEGALTKGPFNMLPAVTDLNNALLSFILTGHQGFSSAAGHIGSRHRVDHDISILVPEIWCRLRPEERDADYLIQEGCLEKIQDFEHQGRIVPASRLGYRINEAFVFRFLCRIFEEPLTIFQPEMLRPELQNLDEYADGIDNIVGAQKKAAQLYFEDGSIEVAIPPLRALLHIMVHGQYQGLGLDAPELRRLFHRDELLSSSWYLDRLKRQQSREITLWKRHLAHLERFISDPRNASIVAGSHLDDRLRFTRSELKRSLSETYVESLRGTIGADPLFKT